MDRVVSVHKYFHERLHIHFVYLAKPLTHEPKELLVCSLLSAAVNDHVTKFLLLAWLDVQLVQLMNRFLKVQGGLDCQVDSSPERDEIGLCRVNDGILLFFWFII